MIKIGKIKKYNLILGIFIGVFLALMVMSEGYAILAASQQKDGLTDVYSLNGDIGPFKVLAIIVFFATIAAFNTKRFRKINLDKIGIYLIIVVIVSFILSIEVIVILCRVIFIIYPELENYLATNYFLSMNLAYMIFFLGISIFLITFIFLVNRKVKYIKYLTKEVKIIKDEGFGKTIKVIGGDELSELCKSINDMSVELGEKIDNEKRIENNKNELIANISHDLKTPLTSIIGYLEILNNENIDEEDKEKYIKIAYNKSLRLKSLVNELFEYTKLASNDIKFEKKRVNIAMLLNQVVGESIINFSEKNINVVLNNPYNEIFCNIDSTQMLRVFENLIKNAEKYSDVDSVFTVKVSLDNENVLISFINKCSDLRGENLESLFEKFYRNDKSRTNEGSGLGLPIAKRIIELHEGKLWAEKLDNNIIFNIKLKKV